MSSFIEPTDKQNEIFESDEKLPLKYFGPGDVKAAMKDIGGFEEAKLEVIEFVNFIKNNERYRKLGARLPKGALLHGPPGNGKTLLARATAGESSVAFISCSGSTLLVGQNGPEKLKKIFEFARKHTPCVLFFDEIDSIGRARNGKRVTSVSRAITEELLVQLDGFEQHEENMVIILGATNAIDVMDKALLRPGRFDRVIRMNKPDLPSRISIYNVHLSPLITNLDKKDLAKKYAISSAGFNGAQIAAVCNESAMIAARELNDDIKKCHFDRALNRVRSGLKKYKALNSDDKKIAAYHDAGHAIAGWFLQGITAPPTQLSVVPNVSGKVICSLPQIRQFDNVNENEALNIIALTLAGRAAQKIIFGEYTTNSSSDFEHATILAMSLVVQHGMCEKIGSIWFKSSFMSKCKYKPEAGMRLPISDAMKNEAIDEIKNILNEANKRAEKILLDNKDKLDKLANELIEKDILGLEELENILGPIPFLDMEKLSASDEDLLPVGLQDWKSKSNAFDEFCRTS